MENPLEQEFLKTYFEGNQYTEKLADEYNEKLKKNNGYHKSLSLAFYECYRAKGDAVTETEFMDFKTRFSYFKVEDNKVLEGTDKHEFKDNYYARVNPFVEIGFMKNGDIYDQNGVMIAKHYGTLGVYHDSGVGFFTGTYEDLISQMPDKLKHSDKPYYFTYKFIECRFGNNKYYVHVDFYEIVSI